MGVLYNLFLIYATMKNMAGTEQTNINGMAGKHALIVGGTNGVGYQIALALAKAGASVVATGRHIPAERCDGVAFMQVDFEKQGTPFEAAALLDDDLAECDILCVCYGPFLYKTLEETTAADWEKISLLDYALPGFLCSCVLPYMKARKWGRILLFGGTRTDKVNGYRKNAVYAGAKTAVSVLVKSIALEYTPSGITCNAIIPGFMEGSAFVPCGVEPVSTVLVAQKALDLLSCPEKTGILLDLSDGWQP